MPTCLIDLGSRFDNIVSKNFLITSVFSNLDYFFWRKNEIEDPKLDRDPFPWIIWYLWKARSDKLFRRITRDPQERVRHDHSECHVWFDVNSKNSDDACPQNQTRNTQSLCLQCIFSVDGSWTSDAQYSGFGWVWLDESRDERLLGLRTKRDARHL